MKIIIATGIFPPDIGGPATYSENLAKELVKKGHKVLVVCYGNNKKENEIDGFKIIKINRNRPVFFRYLDYFLTILRQGKNFDLIFAQDPVSSGFPTMLATKILRKKFVIKIVGDYAWEQAKNKFKIQEGIDDFQNKKYSFISSVIPAKAGISHSAIPAIPPVIPAKAGISYKIKIFRFIQKSVVKNAEKIITPSYYLRDLVKGWGINEKKIKVIYNAVNFDFVKFKEQFNAQKEIGIDGKIILSIARLVPWKGFEMLIDIWPEILQKEKTAKLVIVGDGPEKEKLKNLVENKNLIKNIYLPGNIEHQKLFKYFNSADIFVLNSGYEGLSHVLVEAIAYNLPIIASDKGGNKEIIKDGYNGILVEYNNKEKWKQAILKLLSDENLKKKFINNSAQNLKKFEYSEMIKKTLNILKIC